MFTSIKSLCKISQRKPQRCQTRIWGSLWQKGIENAHSKGSKDCTECTWLFFSRNIFRCGAFKFHSQLNKLERRD